MFFLKQFFMLDSINSMQIIFLHSDVTVSIMLWAGRDLASAWVLRYEEWHLSQEEQERIRNSTTVREALLWLFIYLVFVLQATLGGIAKTLCCAFDRQNINKQSSYLFTRVDFLIHHQEAPTVIPDHFLSSHQADPLLSWQRLYVSWPLHGI